MIHLSVKVQANERSELIELLKKALSTIEEEEWSAGSEVSPEGSGFGFIFRSADEHIRYCKLHSIGYRQDFPVWS